MCHLIPVQLFPVTLFPVTLVLVLTACQIPTVQREEATALLDTQAEAWNRGDIPAFVGYYSPGLTFLGADGLIRGAEGLVERYQDAAARGTLRFEIIDFRPLGSGAALLLGRYHLQRADPATGFFTLVLERTASGLRIIHDHTTAASAEAGPVKAPEAGKPPTFTAPRE